MKALALLFDAVNSISLYSIEATEKSSKYKAKWTLVSFIIIASSLVIALLTILTASFCYDWCIKKKKEKKIHDEEERETGQQTSNLSNKTSNTTNEKKKRICELIMQLVFGLLKVVFAGLYFIGDNFENALTIYDDKCAEDSNCAKRKWAKGVSTILLICGILGFRFIPLLEKEAMQIFKLCQINENNNSNRESDDDKKKRSSYILITTLGTIAEADAWYTAITAYVGCSFLIPLWLAFAFVLVGLLSYFILKIVSFTKIKDCNKKYRVLIAFVILSVILSIPYLLGDNKETLDCLLKDEGNCTMKLKAGCAVLHLVLMGFSGGFYFIIFGTYLIILLCEVNEEYDSLKKKTISCNDQEVIDNGKSSKYITEQIQL